MAAKLNPIIDLDCSRVKRAVIYARVSTDEQADKGYSLGSQLEACRAYAVGHGFTVVAEFDSLPFKCWGVPASSIVL